MRQLADVAKFAQRHTRHGIAVNFINEISAQLFLDGRLAALQQSLVFHCITRKPQNAAGIALLGRANLAVFVCEN